MITIAIHVVFGVCLLFSMHKNHPKPVESVKSYDFIRVDHILTSDDEYHKHQ